MMSVNATIDERISIKKMFYGTHKYIYWAPETVKKEGFFTYWF
jgi:hypothetical protein